MKLERKNSRQSNLELLRIVSMIMIIVLHLLGHGGVLSSAKLFSPNYYIVWILEGISFIAVNCYVLISGYFLINSEFKVKKLIFLLLEVLFYSVGIYFVLLASGVISFSFGSALKAFLPTLSNQYWFITVYVVLYILSPFLNIAIKSMTRKQHLMAVITSLFLFSLIPNVIFFASDFNFGMGMGIVWFVVLYFIAAYIRRYYQPSYNVKKPLLLYLSVALLVPISKFFIAFLSRTFVTKFVGAEELIGGSGLFYSYNSILVATASILFFILFLNIKIEGKIANIINALASLTLGVYLIHDNTNLRDYLWNFINARSYLDKWYFIFIIFAVILSLYFICSGIEYLRRRLFYIIERSKRLDLLINRIEAKYNKVFANSKF